MGKEFGNFDKIKEQMLASKAKAETVNSDAENTEKGDGESSPQSTKKNTSKSASSSSKNKSVGSTIEQYENSTDGKSDGEYQETSSKNYVESSDVPENTGGEEMVIRMPVLKKKPKKKAVNYYMSEDVINKVKAEAGNYNLKDSNFLEELLRQVLNVPQ